MACVSSTLQGKLLRGIATSFSNVACAGKIFLTSASLTTRICAPSQHLLHVRHKWVFKRRFDPGPVPDDVHGQRYARVAQFAQRHEILDLVECTHESPLAPIDLLLLKDIPGVGIAGEVKNIARLRARNALIPQRLATYATEQYVKEYADMIRERAHLIYKPSSSTAMFMVDHIRKMVLNVPLNFHNPWTLEKYHIRAALRRRGIWATEEAFVKMPKRPIVGPNRDMHGRCFTVTLLINGREKVALLCRIQLVSNDPADMRTLPVLDSGGEIGLGLDEGRQYEEVFPGAVYKLLRPDEEHALNASKSYSTENADEKLSGSATN